MFVFIYGFVYCFPCSLFCFLSLFFFFLFVSVSLWASCIPFWLMVLFCLGAFLFFCLFVYISYFIFPFCAVWLVKSWWFSKASGLNLWGGRPESRKRDHREFSTPWNINEQELSISTLRPGPTQRPNYSARHHIPNSHQNRNATLPKVIQSSQIPHNTPVDTTLPFIETRSSSTHQNIDITTSRPGNHHKSLGQPHPQGQIL